MERLPRDAGGIGDPVLVRSRVTARHIFFLDDPRIGRREARMHPRELRRVVHLEAEMVHARSTAALRDREVHARIVEHPFRVVGLHDARLRAEHHGIEPDALLELGNGDVHVEALHALLL